ncbi:MAG: GAF domain-containing protein [Microcoleus sp. SIO2G3]|nr:GAF domain-containing protein [Microcoleus sp. SIO2G3]
MGQQHLQPDNENQFVALGRTLQTLREEENTEVLIETTLDYLTNEFDYRLIWIGLYDRLDHRLFGKGGITPTGDTTFLKQRFNLNPGELLEQVVIELRPVGVPDLQQEPRAGEWRRAAQDFEIQGTIIFPLRYKDRCFGVALLGSQEWGASPRPAEKAQLSMVLGGLAAALYQIEANWQRAATKRPDQYLFQGLNELMEIPALTLRLEAVVRMTQEFVAPTRTNLYWYSPERRYFWHRMGNRQPLARLAESRTTTAGLKVAEATDFYQALAAGQMVAIGAGRSLLTPESTERLLARLRTRSLLAAPIQANGELLGFLAVEDREPRIWEQGETSYVRAIAQLVALVQGNEEIEATLEQAQKDIHLSAEISQAIARSNDTTTALKGCADLLCKRLDAERFLVLQENALGEFVVVFGTQPANRRSLTTPLAPLSPEDRQLFNGSDAIAIEDLDLEWRLTPWRKVLSQLGVRSALLISLGQSHLSPETSQINNSSHSTPLLLIGHSAPRTWNHTQQDLVSVVVQQMSLLFTVDQLQENARLSLLAHQTLQAGLSTLQEAPLDLPLFDRTWVQYLATLMECPLAVLLSWTPESASATVASAVVADPRFAFPPDLAIPVASNTLIQEVLATHGFLCRPLASFDASTHKWLSRPGIGQVLAIALHAGVTPTTGILLLADHEKRQWPQHLLPSLETLTSQFTWLRHYRHRLSLQAQESGNLQILNWYKHRCLEALYHSVVQSVRTLFALEPGTSLPNTQELNLDTSGDLAEMNVTPTLVSGQPPRSISRQALLHQLEETLTLLTPVLKKEQWQLQVNLRPVPLGHLLKRSLRCVEPLYHQRQIMRKVHNVGNQSVYGDPLKLECILFELLITACFQAPPGSWINLWCNPTPPNSSPALLELLITESGLLEDCLKTLATSPLAPPTLNLKICRDILAAWGGDLQFYPLKGDRFSSRLLLPLPK